MLVPPERKKLPWAKQLILLSKYPVYVVNKVFETVDDNTMGERVYVSEGIILSSSERSWGRFIVIASHKIS